MINVFNMPQQGHQIMKIKWNLELVSDIKSLINTCKWKGINYPSKVEDW